MPPCLDTACFSRDLQKGCEYIGWIGGAITALNAIFDVYGFTRPNEVHNHIMFDIIVSLIQYLISMALIKGARRKNRSLVLSWLVISIINLAVFNLFDLVKTILLPGLAGFYLLRILIIDIISAYVWLCVYSFYQVIVEAPVSDHETVIIEHAGTTRV